MIVHCAASNIVEWSLSPHFEPGLFVAQFNFHFDDFDNNDIFPSWNFSQIEEAIIADPTDLRNTLIES